MNVELSNVIFAFSLTLFAGLSTGIGSTLALLTKRTSTRFLSIALGFSAGVMLYVSFVDILVKANESLAVSRTYNRSMGSSRGILFWHIVDRGH